MSLGNAKSQESRDRLAICPKQSLRSPSYSGKRHTERLSRARAAITGDRRRFRSYNATNSRRTLGGKQILTAQPLLFDDDIEQPPADEDEDIARIIAIVRQTLERQRKRNGHSRRDVHVKAHGCATAEFKVRPELPAQLAQGLFAQPKTYAAFVRFSNSAPWHQPDAIPDGRGMALQVENGLAPRINAVDSSRTQDFVMVNHTTFIARDVRDYLRLEEARLQAALHPARLAAKLLTKACNPLRWRWRALLAAARVAGQAPSHPANYTYYSMVPIRFGRYVVKYRVIPCSQQSSSVLGKLATFGLQADAMRHLLEDTLSQQEIKFDFQVQLRTSAQSMPIEDATIEWPESESPYQTVAELILPRQNVSGLRTNEEGDRRAFSVWNGLADHRPLGGINRSRRLAYVASAEFRSAQPRLNG